MPTDIDRDGVRRLMEEGARVVEVLPAEDYEEEHIAGAINIPLRHLDRETAGKAGLHPDRPVIVYCNDCQ
jgi:rhodanese-related sulfurtransferase